VNGRDEIIYTYMGKLLPRLRNATYSGAGALNPLMNDPDYETIGIGTRIFLGGAQGYVIGEGTQHEPQNLNGTLMVRGNAKNMNTEFLRGATYTRYGTTLYVGLGIPIPILNMGLAKKTAIRDEEIFTNVVDYGVPRRNRPKLAKVSYKELKSGAINVEGKRIRVSSLSSLKTARKVAGTLKSWIENGEFFLTTAVERLPLDTVFKPMRQTEETPFVANVMHKAVTCNERESVQAVAELIVTRSVNHIVVVDNQGKLNGIVTSWDITRALAQRKETLEDIVTRRVITAKPDEPLETARNGWRSTGFRLFPLLTASRKCWA